VVVRRASSKFQGLKEVAKWRDFIATRGSFISHRNHTFAGGQQGPRPTTNAHAAGPTADKHTRAYVCAILTAWERVRARLNDCVRKRVCGPSYSARVFGGTFGHPELFSQTLLFFPEVLKTLFAGILGRAGGKPREECTQNTG